MQPQQSPDRFRDFDQFFAEQQRTPVRFRLFGEEHELPPAMPAALMLQFLRLKERGNGEQVGDEEAVRLFEAVFGAARLAALSAKGMDMEQLMALLEWVMEQYGAGATPSPKTTAKVRRGKTRP